MKFIKPTLITIIAPTCSGKSVLLNALVENYNFSRIVSTTTRAKRANETEGIDYFFISEEASIELEKQNNFVELVEFGGARYGVTKNEMLQKLSMDKIPCIIIEPFGIEQYEKFCLNSGVELFKIFVQTLESTRIARLNTRTHDDIQAAQSKNYYKIIETHTNRLKSIMGEERRWRTISKWDVKVSGGDGDDSIGISTAKAIADIEIAINYRNKRYAKAAQRML